MPIQEIPEIFLSNNKKDADLFVYDYRMTIDVVKNKVNLSSNMFSFLQTGHKEVHLGGTNASVNENQSLLIKNGNCLMTELLAKDQVYFCKLFFFSQKNVNDFLEKHPNLAIDSENLEQKETPLFTIENDAYIKSFVISLSSILDSKMEYNQNFLFVKFEEIMLYLVHKYGDPFVQYIQSLVVSESNLSFRKIVEAKAYSNLKLNEIAFLYNMSLSTFKRHFINEYKISPGKWLKQKRLQHAKQILRKGKLKPSEIYLELGYSSLSNFSIAFKNEFGVSPKQMIE